MAIDNPAAAPRLTRWRRFRESVDIWHISAASGLLAAAGAWTIWYFSKIPCTIELARAGACNPSTLANLITLPALTSILAIGAGVATLAGGYSYAMVSKANRRADEAELRLQQERERNDAERQLERERNAQLMEEMRAELSAQRQQAAVERQRADTERQQTSETTQQLIQQMLEERSQSAAIQQAIMTTLSEMNTHLVRMTEQHQNGRSNDDV